MPRFEARLNILAPEVPRKPRCIGAMEEHLLMCPGEHPWSWIYQTYLFFIFPPAHFAISFHHQTLIAQRGSGDTPPSATSPRPLSRGKNILRTEFTSPKKYPVPECIPERNGVSRAESQMINAKVQRFEPGSFVPEELTTIVDENETIVR